MEYFVALIWISIEFMCLYFMCKVFLSQRRSNKTTFLVLTIAGMLIFSIGNLNIAPFNSHPYILKGVSYFICLFASFIAYKSSWYNYLIIISIYYFSLGAVDTVSIYGMASLMGITVMELIWKKWLYTVTVTLGKCILLFCAWATFYYGGKGPKYKLSNRRMLLSATFPFISVVMLYTVYDSYRYQDDLSISAVIFSVILVISNIAIIYLMTSLERATRAEQEIAILNQSMALQTENIQSLEKSYRAQRTATHEFKHQLQIIHDLLEGGNSTAAMDYIDQLQITHTSRIFAVRTKHPIVDAILNEKYHTAKDYAIDINFKVNDLSNLKISTDSLVVLLSNLLDNAIEACQRYPADRIIDCTLLLEDNLFFSIRNTSLPVKIRNGNIETIKEPRSEHGFGLAGVRRVLKQLNGEYAIDYADNWFQFVAEIPIQNR